MGDDERLLQSAGTDVGMRRWSQSCTARSRGLLLLLLELESMGRGGVDNEFQHFAEKNAGRMKSSSKKKATLLKKAEGFPVAFSSTLGR